MNKNYEQDNLIRILKRENLDEKSDTMLPIPGKVLLRIVKRGETVKRKQTRTPDYAFSTLLASHGR